MRIFKRLDAVEILPYSAMQTKLRGSEKSSNAVIHFVNGCHAKVGGYTKRTMMLPLRKSNFSGAAALA
jgi:hypothetical protein